MSKKIFQKWTDEEIKILTLNVNELDINLQELFPNRSLKSIKHKISNLGLQRKSVLKRYTQDELDFLKNNYFLNKEDIMLHLGRDWESIRKKLFELGIDYHLGFKYWTKDEVDLLSNVSSIEEAITLFPNRSESSIKNKIVEKGNPEIIADKLGRNIQSVYVKANRLGLNIDSEFKNRVVLSGEQHPMWKGGVTSENARLRDSKEFKNWRLEVFERDKYTCQCCGDNKGGNLHAHHIENFSNIEEKRFDADNGITLCADCHDPCIKGSFHHVYGTRDNNREQLDEYISNYKYHQSKYEFIHN